MNKEKLVQNLKQIKQLTEECLSGFSREKIIKNRNVLPKIQKVSTRKSLTDHVIELRDGGFFKKSKIAKEVHAKLQMIYPCDLNRFEVALVRLLQKKQFRKTLKVQDGKKITAYVW